MARGVPGFTGHLIGHACIRRQYADSIAGAGVGRAVPGGRVDRRTRAGERQERDGGLNARGLDSARRLSRTRGRGTMAATIDPLGTGGDEPEEVVLLRDVRVA